jgi:hypothetical protein
MRCTRERSVGVPLSRDLLRGACVLFALVAGGALGLFGTTTTTDSRTYSAYADPQKTAISFILSDPKNVAELRERFALGDEEIKSILAAVREENEIVAREYSESERIVEASEELPDERVKERIAASDYDEKVRAVIAKTKSTVRALLPKESRSELKEWVDNQWRQEVHEFHEFEASEATAFSAYEEATYQATATGVRCRVFATQYIGYTRYEVALPHKILKENYLDGNTFRVRLRRGDYATRAPVKEVGPWNIRDNYWQSRRYRDMWDDLPRCMPEAQAAYFDNYNRGRDQFGRIVRNPAGVDLTPRVARRLGLRLYENAWIYVRYPWVQA